MRALKKESLLLIGDLSSKEKEDNTNTPFTDQVTLPCRYTCTILLFILKHFNRLQQMVSYLCSGDAPG